MLLSQLHINEVIRYDRERYLCVLMNPAEKREALLTLLAFNLEIARMSGAVSEPMIGMIRQAWWREALEEIAVGKKPRPHEVLSAMDVVMLQYQLPLEKLVAMVEARVADLEQAPFADEKAFLDYASATGGIMLELWLRILGVDETHEASSKAALLIGRAWAIIGIIRALPHELTHKHVRLPMSLLQNVGLTAEAVIDNPPSEALFGVVKTLVAQAEKDLLDARRLRSKIAKDARPALYLAILAEDFAKRLRHVGYNPFHEFQETGRARRVFSLLVASILKRY